MNINDEKFDDHSLFQQKFTKDPFRESNFVHLDEKTPPQQSSASPTPPQDPFDDDDEPRTLMTILKGASKQIIVSAIILVIGFLAINWSAYYQIAKNEIQKMTGTKEESPLMELVELPTDSPGATEGQGTTFKTKTVLTTSTDPDIQKRQIPDLDLEVAPVDNRIVIARINKNIPVVRVSSENLIKRDWAALESDIQGALKEGVVHYPGTAIPGQGGNTVITGHSSYFPWDPGRFKDVFALLHDVVIGDRIAVYYDQKKYIYEIQDIQIVLPKDIAVLEKADEETLTLITCTPVGTNLKRLIITAKPIQSETPERKLKRA